MPVRGQGSEWETIQQEIRKLHPTTPIMILGGKSSSTAEKWHCDSNCTPLGHTHIRDCGKSRIVATFIHFADEVTTSAT